MSKTPTNTTSGQRKRLSKSWIAVAVVGVAVAVLIIVTQWPARKPSSESAVATSAAPATATSGAESKPNLQFLKGRWVRPDGGYVLEIRKVDADGQLDASYLNPSPIRVTSAVASKDGEATKVLIELNDVNYPGCKYNLTYIPNRDILVGTYYQAAMRETFDVGFEREK